MHRPAPLKKSLRDQLLTKPYTFEFAQAIHLLHFFKKDAAPLGVGIDPLREVAQLKSRIFLSAPPSDLYKIKKSWREFEDGSLALGRGIHTSKKIWYTPSPYPLLTYQHAFDKNLLVTQSDDDIFAHGPLEVQVNFLGIAGIQGPLPVPYTEMILSRLRQKDATLRDFLDLFNHRLLSLFYRIVQKSNPALHWAKPQDTPVGKALVRLMGVGTDHVTAFPPRALLFYTCFLWKKPHTASALARILTHYFEHPVDILPFQGRWFELDIYKRTCLGGPNPQNNTLGQRAVLGSQVWCQDQSFTVCLTIKTPEEFLSFLPNGDAYSVLKQLVTFYAGPRFSFRIALKLIHKPPSSLNKSRAFPFVLGRTSWLLRNTSFLDTPWVVVS